MQTKQQLFVAPGQRFIVVCHLMIQFWMQYALIRSSEMQTQVKRLPAPVLAKTE